MNIYEKLIEVRKAVPYLRKEAEGYQFKYTSSSQVLGNLKAKMDEVGLLLVPNVTNTKVNIDVYEKTDNKGNAKRTVDYFTEIHVTFTWINAEKPEEQISCPWYGQGVDTAGEKGVGKALTYAEKYFMLKFFNIPTDKDDPDSFQQKIDNNADKTKAERGQSSKPKVPPIQPNKPVNVPPAAPTEDKISEAQRKRIFALSKGDANLAKEIIGAYGYEHSKDIKRTDYQKICKDIEDRVSA